MGRRKMSMEEKFFKWVSIGEENECWEFQGRSLAGGYGLLTFKENGKSRAVLCHRFAYEYFVGPIPDGLFILHSCDNPLCSNPNHLRPGTASDNMRDMVARKRHPRLNVTHCPRGHEYNEQNTYVRKSGARQCRVCDRIYQNAKYRKKRNETVNG